MTARSSGVGLAKCWGDLEAVCATFSDIVCLMGVVASGNLEEAQLTLGISPNKADSLLRLNPQTSEPAAPSSTLPGPPGAAILLVLRLKLPTAEELKQESSRSVKS